MEKHKGKITAIKELRALLKGYSSSKSQAPDLKEIHHRLKAYYPTRFSPANNPYSLDYTNPYVASGTETEIVGWALDAIENHAFDAAKKFIDQLEDSIKTELPPTFGDIGVGY